jgi:hypothetical protein
MRSRTATTALLLAAAIMMLMTLTGCGKKMADEKFAAVAGTIYSNVKTQWDHQASESWATYYERRIAEACAENGTSVVEWNEKMKDVVAHPEKYEKVVEKDVLNSLLQWEEQRQAAKQG